jgi:hypothetical protein
VDSNVWIGKKEVKVKDDLESCQERREGGGVTTRGSDSKKNWRDKLRGRKEGRARQTCPICVSSYCDAMKRTLTERNGQARGLCIDE